METISRLLLVFLINALWQSLVVILLASLCDWLMRNAPARFRHWLWVIALIICLGLPLSNLTGLGQPPAPGLSSPAIAPVEGEPSERSASANGVNDIWRRNFPSIQPAPLAGDLGFGQRPEYADYHQRASEQQGEDGLQKAVGYVLTLSISAPTARSFSSIFS